jgi:hypothetical protein
MARHLSPVPTLALLLLLAAPANASRVVVPDDYATIQAALDGDADTIAVRDGLTPERLTIRRYVVLEPATNVHPFDRFSESYPSIQSLVMPDLAGEGQLSVRGFRFLGHVSLWTDWEYAEWPRLSFESCRFDSALARPGDYAYATVTLRGCLVLGSLDIEANSVQIVGCTIVGGTLKVRTDGLHDLRHNLVLGPADVGIDALLDSGDGVFDGNTVRGTNVGMRVLLRIGASHVTNNVVEDCASHGMVFGSMRSITGNTVRRCGGDGIRVEDDRWWPSDSITKNRVEDCGGVGIRSSAAYGPIDSNTVLRCEGPGIAAARQRHRTLGTAGHRHRANQLLPGTRAAREQHSLCERRTRDPAHRLCRLQHRHRPQQHLRRQHRPGARVERSRRRGPRVQ